MMKWAASTKANGRQERRGEAKKGEREKRKRVCVCACVFGTPPTDLVGVGDEASGHDEGEGEGEGEQRPVDDELGAPGGRGVVNGPSNSRTGGLDSLVVARVPR